ncbi:MAG: FmdB family zinc ribbon protein [Gemmatimonadales bacterium]
MPTYEYKCPSEHLFEKSFPRITSKRHATCPTCGRRAERLISGGAGLVFKGSGFYVTDYKRAGEKTEKAEKTEKTEKKTDGAQKLAESKPPPKKDSSSDK